MGYTGGEWEYGFDGTKCFICTDKDKPGDEAIALINCDKPEYRANARLIAQSPRMVKLLVRLLGISFSTDDENYNEVSLVLEDAQEIIETLDL